MNQSSDFEAPIIEIENMIEKLKSISDDKRDEVAGQIAELEERLARQRGEIYANLTPWQTVQVARHKNRPVLSDYIAMIYTDFVELHGDRRIADDRAIMGGFARIGKHDIMLIGHNKGKTVEENIERNFGQARPDGYRKALRLMKLAEKYGLPVVTFIDTSGAFPGLDAEERGQAEAIARNLTEMARLEVPIICVVTGEGGSGGALGIGVGDVILMLSNSVYSVISPEGCASILWRDGAYASQAAEALKLTANSLAEMGVVDEIIPEAGGAAHHNPKQTAAEVKKAVVKHLKRLKGWSPSRLTHRRFEKYSKMGFFTK
ncbi:MAG: acetyl-CoA carboxylase carboxyltransferase subunit alpha [Chitinivibrionales bacterium]|nr:acetyl-CoA carboxylase carboxyltransferase subunit alpha [Chitinivibrionales bacterium]MBD3394130.1 acetyl-CoA carboxylase carboxyltransferase subunit alpha [Chitinivibrionales bacterium]